LEWTFVKLKIQKNITTFFFLSLVVGPSNLAAEPLNLVAKRPYRPQLLSPKIAHLRRATPSVGRTPQAADPWDCMTLGVSCAPQVADT